MSILIRFLSILLLALPLSASAELVTVTTRSTGLANPNDAVLTNLGLNPVGMTGPQAYELTLRSTFDTATVPPESFWAYSYGKDVEIDFRFGAQVYHYAGPADSIANLSAQSANVEEYGHRIAFYEPNYSYGFFNEIHGPTGSLGQFNPLAPLAADDSDGLTGYATANLVPPPDVYDVFVIGGRTSTISVQVSPVPEPAPFAMLGIGILALGLMRRTGRVSPAAQPVT
jgi:hypothetical protein